MSSNFIFKGQQGYPLSAIVDEPNLRVNGFTTAQSSVHLICQKNQGMQHPMSQYVIVNCQIVVDTPGFAGKLRANIDSLLPTLSHYISQVIVRQFDQYAKKISYYYQLVYAYDNLYILRSRATRLLVFIILQMYLMSA